MCLLLHHCVVNVTNYPGRGRGRAGSLPCEMCEGIILEGCSWFLQPQSLLQGTPLADPALAAITTTASDSPLPDSKSKIDRKNCSLFPFLVYHPLGAVSRCCASLMWHETDTGLLGHPALGGSWHGILGSLSSTRYYQFCLNANFVCRDWTPNVMAGGQTAGAGAGRGHWQPE